MGDFVLDADNGAAAESVVVDALVEFSPFPQRVKDKVCIVGFAESSRHETPFGDDSFEFWGLNRLHAVVEHTDWDRWFQIHDINDPRIAATPDHQQHVAWLKEQPFPVYLRPQDVGTVDLPNAQPYPYDAILTRFSKFAGGRYFTNSISWLIALAIAMGYREIRIYGVDMAMDTVLMSEYSMQKPSCEYWIGVAEAAGIEVFIPPGADLLLTPYLYGFEPGDVFTQKMTHRLAELGQRKENVKQQVGQIDEQLGQLQAQRQNAITQIQHLDGAMQNCQYIIRNLIPQLTVAVQKDASMNGDGHNGGGGHGG